MPTAYPRQKALGRREKMRARASEERGAWAKEEEEKGRGESISSMAVPGPLTFCFISDNYRLHTLTKKVGVGFLPW